MGEKAIKGKAITKVLSCLVVFAILMSAVPVSIFAMEDNNSKGNVSNRSNETLLEKAFTEKSSAEATMPFFTNNTTDVQHLAFNKTVNNSKSNMSNYSNKSAIPVSNNNETTIQHLNLSANNTVNNSAGNISVSTNETVMTFSVKNVTDVQNLTEASEIVENNSENLSVSIRGAQTAANLPLGIYIHAWNDMLKQKNQEDLIKELKQHGINRIFVDVYSPEGEAKGVLQIKEKGNWEGTTNKPRFTGRYDLYSLIEKAHNKNIEVHATVCCFGGSGVPKESVYPTSVIHRRHLREVITYLLRNFKDLDGIHLDYIRYMTEHGYMAGEDTDTVAAFIQQCNGIVVGKDLSAAVFAAYDEDSYKYVWHDVGQDYSKMSQYLNFICPMVYHYPHHPVSWVGDVTKFVKQKVDVNCLVVPDIQTFVDGDKEEPGYKEVKDAISSAIENGADGINIFVYDRTSEGEWQAVDEIQPIVIITSPTNGAKVTGTATITAGVLNSDYFNIQNVTFRATTSTLIQSPPCTTSIADLIEKWNEYPTEQNSILNKQYTLHGTVVASTRPYAEAGKIIADVGIGSLEKLFSFFGWPGKISAKILEFFKEIYKWLFGEFEYMLIIGDTREDQIFYDEHIAPPLIFAQGVDEKSWIREGSITEMKGTLKHKETKILGRTIFKGPVFEVEKIKHDEPLGYTFPGSIMLEHIPTGNAVITRGLVRDVDNNKPYILQISNAWDGKNDLELYVNMYNVNLYPPAEGSLIEVRGEYSGKIVERGVHKYFINAEKVNVIYGNLKHVDKTPPYSWKWDTTTTIDGPRKIAARAYDATGKYGQDGIDVSVSNLPLPEFTPLDLCMVLDRSGSMRDPMGAKTKIQGVKEAATGVVNVLLPQDRVSIISFSTTATTDIDFTTDFNAVKTKINQLSAGGDTSFGAGLKLALDQFNAYGNPDHIPAILFMSDGHHNTAPAPDAFVTECKNKGIPIFTVGFASSESQVDVARLKRMSDETGGEYRFVGEIFDLQNIFLKLQHKAAGWESIATYVGEVNQGETVTAGSFYVDPAINNLRVTLNWPGSNLDLKLFNPNGRQVDFGAPNVIYSGDTKPEYVIIKDPQSGTWTVKVYGKSIGSSEKYYALVTNLTLSFYK